MVDTRRKYDVTRYSADVEMGKIGEKNAFNAFKMDMCISKHLEQQETTSTIT